MFVKTMSMLMVATLTLFAADAGKSPVANPVKDNVTKEQKASVASAPVTPAVKTSTASSNNVSNQVNINTATAAELQKLHGIGAAKAKAIVDYRKAHGEFKNANDLINVPGIGDKTFADIKGDVKVR